MQNTVEVNDVTMRFRLSNDRVNSIKEFTIQKLTGKMKYNDFVALSHVSFSVRPGEVFGILGHNGAGKSTLLKIISGILKPSEGNVIVRGSIAPMLELGTGFDRDMSGRENIFLNGAILGYTESFIRKKEEEIIDFSGIEQFIDQPLRNYSSGMIARLAFAIATEVQPEIMIVDEVLSVGDSDFRTKSANRMTELMQSGATVIFVSHNIAQLAKISSRLLWLEHGEVIRIGDPVEIVREYDPNIILDSDD